jgi:HD-GYP domain-containing protein (c-di-GMP phosphodiesterase class II)
LHDVGKIGIPNALINKPDKLSTEEFEVMMRHPFIGQDILKGITSINNLAAGAAEHHEHWNGSGYCLGITGDNISIEGRIIALADAYDAMSSDRSYRKKLPIKTILEEFLRCKGGQFDPKITDIVINMIEQDHFDVIDINKIIDIENDKGV